MSAPCSLGCGRKANSSRGLCYVCLRHHKDAGDLEAVAPAKARDPRMIRLFLDPASCEACAEIAEVRARITAKGRGDLLVEPDRILVPLWPAGDRNRLLRAHRTHVA